ncbi:hypothetical protein [Streptomyces yatensis]|nr:hypothetical protein [Streptomyces yatensis]
MGDPADADLRRCAAIVDRLTFNGTTIETGTDSYRLAGTRSRAEGPAKTGWSSQRDPSDRPHSQR